MGSCSQALGADSLALCPLPSAAGEQCQLRDFCSANPCMNGGVCLTTYPQIQCRCPPGFEGHACERDVNECFGDPAPCPEGIACHNTLGSFQCVCPAGRTGPRCALWAGPCPPAGCPNGGTCQLVPGEDSPSHLCLCPPGVCSQGRPAPPWAGGGPPSADPGPCQVSQARAVR